MGTGGRAQGEGTPTRHRGPGETGVRNSVRRPKMIALGCPRASGPCRAVVSAIARPGPGVRGDPILLTTWRACQESFRRVTGAMTGQMRLKTRDLRSGAKHMVFSPIVMAPPYWLLRLGLGQQCFPPSGGRAADGQRPRTEAGPLDSVRRPSGRRPCDPVDDDVMTSARDWSRTARGRPNYRACGDRRSGESSGSDTPDRHGNERRSRNVNKNKTFGRNSDRRYGKNYELISDDDTSSSDSDASPVGHSRIDNKRDSRRYEKSYGLGRRNGREGHGSVSADRHDSHRRKGKSDERNVGVKFSHRSRGVKEQTKSRNKTGRACIDCDSDKSGSEAEYQSVHRKSGTQAVKSTHRKHKHKRDKGSRVHSDSEGELPRRKKSPDDVHLLRSRAPENTHRHACKRSVSRDAKRDSESSADSRRVLPTLKLGSYDGTSCLETFLAKFRNISEYYSWSERNQLCHLRASLEGRAGQVLWDAGKHGTVTELIELLKNLFGTQDQTKMLRQVTQSKN